MSGAAKNIDPPAGPQAADDKNDSDEKTGMAQLENKIEEVVVNVLDKLGLKDGGKKTATAEPGSPDIAAQVRKAVADAKAEDQRTAAEKARDDRIKALEDAKAAREHQPRQFRLIERFFGWAREEDNR